MLAIFLIQGLEEILKGMKLMLWNLLQLISRNELSEMEEVKGFWKFHMKWYNDHCSKQRGIRCVRIMI